MKVTSIHISISDMADLRVKAVLRKHKKKNRSLVSEAHSLELDAYHS